MFGARASSPATLSRCRRGRARCAPWVARVPCGMRVYARRLRGKRCFSGGSVALLTTNASRQVSAVPHVSRREAVHAVIFCSGRAAGWCSPWRARSSAGTPSRRANARNAARLDRGSRGRDLYVHPGCAGDAPHPAACAAFARQGRSSRGCRLRRWRGRPPRRPSSGESRVAHAPSRSCAARAEATAGSAARFPSGTRSSGDDEVRPSPT